MAEDYLAKYRKKQADKPKDYLAQYRGKSFGQMTLDAAKVAALPVTWTLEQLGNRIDATTAAAMDPITQKFATGESKPLGQSLADLARAPITGQPPEGYTQGDAAYEAGVKGGLEPWQARTLSFLGSFPAASGLNAFGRGVALPAARAVANAEIRLGRSLPKVTSDAVFRAVSKQELDAIKATGAIKSSNATALPVEKNLGLTAFASTQEETEMYRRLGAEYLLRVSRAPSMSNRWTEIPNLVARRAELEKELAEVSATLAKNGPGWENAGMFQKWQSEIAGELDEIGAILAKHPTNAAAASGPGVRLPYPQTPEPVPASNIERVFGPGGRDVTQELGFGSPGKTLSLRRAPGIKQALEFFGQSGATLPNRYREPFQAALREAEGSQNVRAFLRDRSLRDASKLSDEAQDAIAQAIETNTIGSLPKDLQAVANAVRTENRAMVADRLRSGLRPNELESDEIEYAARVLTKEARKARGLKPYGSASQNVPPPALSTSLGKGRTEAGRELTSAQMAAADATEGRRLFEPVVKGTLVKGRSNDAAVVHAKIVNALDKQFGRAAKEGEATIGSIKGIPTGFTEGRAAALKGRALPPEIHRELERMNKTFEPRQWGKAQEAIRVINDEFRRWALFSPGFLSRNMQNNVVQNVIAGNADAAAPARWGRAVALRNRFQRGKETAKDLPALKEYIENGVIGGGQISLDIPRGGKIFGGMFDKWRNANQFAEDVSRMALYDYFKSTGLGAKEAANRVNVWLFNYSPTFRSQGFQQARRTVFPFINWRSQVPGLFVRSTLERPGSLGQAGNLRNQLNAQVPEGALEDLPEWAQRQAPTYNPLTKDFAIPQAVGQFDADEIAENLRRGPAGWARLAITNAYPQFGLAAGEAAQKNFFLDRPYEYKPGQPRMAAAPAFFKFVASTDSGKQFLKEQGFSVKDDGSVLAPVRVATWLNAFPQLRLANIAADIIKPDPNSEFRLKSFLVGLREVRGRPDKKNGK